MAGIITIKIKASTLLEVIVAMVVILIVFALATGIYTNIARSSPSIKEQRIRTVSSGLIQESINENNWKDEVFEIDSVAFQKTVMPYKDYPDLMQISIIAVERGTQIGISRRIIKPAENEDK